MRECEYWWADESEQWCDLISDLCGCGGSRIKCMLDTATIADALRKMHKPTLNELSTRIKKRRHIDDVG